MCDERVTDRGHTSHTPVDLRAFAVDVPCLSEEGGDSSRPSSMCERAQTGGEIVRFVSIHRDPPAAETTFSFNHTHSRHREWRETPLSGKEPEPWRAGALTFSEKRIIERGTAGTRTGRWRAP